jgi:predicted RNA binding protein YcfA (HicA-like mRNA interferase family)
MKLPRDLSGLELAKRLSSLGYEITRQNGSHMRLSTWQNGGHHITIPCHDPLRVGTCSAILTEVGKHFSLNREALLTKLFSTK